jgi:hypothetical protein
VTSKHILIKRLMYAVYRKRHEVIVEEEVPVAGIRNIKSDTMDISNIVTQIHLLVYYFDTRLDIVYNL